VSLAGVLLGLGLLVWLAYRGWSVLLLAPLAALVAAAFAGERLLASWTQTFMGSATQFVAQFFPLFLLGALSGMLMEDSGAVETIAAFMTKKLGVRCSPWCWPAPSGEAERIAFKNLARFALDQLAGADKNDLAAVEEALADLGEDDGFGAARPERSRYLPPRPGCEPSGCRTG
jgi:hypothetical protein